MTKIVAAKSDLAHSKAEVDKIDIDKLKIVPVHLSKLSKKVNNSVVKKTVYDKLVAKVNAIYTGGFGLKTKYGTDKSALEKKINDADKKIPDISRLVKVTDCNAKKTIEDRRIKGKIPSIYGYATTAALTTVENKKPSVSNLVKKKQIMTQK